MAKEGNKGGKGKLIGIILGVLLLGGGSVVGLAVMGKINIPGLTPKKKKGAGMYGDADLAKMYGDKKDEAPKAAPVAKKKEEPEIPAESPPEVDKKKGSEALAEIFNSMPNDKIIAITKDWSEVDLAMLFMGMEAEKTAALLALLPPGKASKVSEEIKRLAGTLAS